MWYDLVILAILALAAWRGASKGMVWQLASIAGIVVCFFFAGTVSLALSPYLGLEPPLDRWVSIFVLYIGSSFAAFGLARLIRGAMEEMKLQDFDRHIGLVLGLVKGALFSIVVTFFMVTLSEQTREIAFHSNSGYACAVLMERIEPVLPQELHTILDKYLEKLDPNVIVDHRDQHSDPNAPHDHDHDHETGTPGTTTQNPPATGSGTTTAEQTLEQYRAIINSLPGIYSDELSQLVLNSWRNTNEKDREELYQKLQVGVPGIIRRVANEWAEGKPQPAPEVKADMQQLVAMINDIAGVYTDQIQAQELITDEIGFALSGLPTGVVSAVLRDWHADVLKSSVDPDPSTNANLPLDHRIVHHLEKQQIKLTSLKSELQQRLSQVTTRR